MDTEVSAQSVFKIAIQNLMIAERIAKESILLGAGGFQY